MNKPIVVDSSVLLAVIRAEFSDTEILTGAIMSAVNLAEVVSKGADLGLGPNQLRPTLQLLDHIAPFNEAQANRAGELRPLTRAAGLSLGDRACLALALDLDADVNTADRAWASLALPCRIHLIR